MTLYNIYLMYADNHKTEEKNNIRYLLIGQTYECEEAKKQVELPLEAYLNELQARHDGYYGSLKPLPHTTSDWEWDDNYENNYEKDESRLWLNIDSDYYKEADGKHDPLGTVVGAMIETIY